MTRRMAPGPVSVPLLIWMNGRRWQGGWLSELFLFLLSVWMNGEKWRRVWFLNPLLFLYSARANEGRQCSRLFVELFLSFSSFSSAAKLKWSSWSFSFAPLSFPSWSHVCFATFIPIFPHYPFFVSTFSFLIFYCNFPSVFSSVSYFPPWSSVYFSSSLSTFNVCSLFSVTTYIFSFLPSIFLCSCLESLQDIFPICKRPKLHSTTPNTCHIRRLTTAWHLERPHPHRPSSAASHYTLQEDDSTIELNVFHSFMLRMKMRNNSWSIYYMVESFTRALNPVDK